MADIPVKQGSPIPLNAQSKSGRTDLVIKATVHQLPGFAQIGSQVTLTHKGNGAYSANGPNMTSDVRLFGQYLVFESDGVTLNKKGDQVVQDIFILETDPPTTALAAGDFVMGKVIEDDIIKGIVDDDNIEAEISEDSIGGQVIEDEVQGTVSDDSIFGEI